MIEFPSTTTVNRILPKDKFVEHLDLTPNLKKKLISDVVHIKILNKFSKSVLGFREDGDEEDCPKSLHLRGGVRRKSDGGVTEFEVKHYSMEQTSSQAENGENRGQGFCQGMNVTTDYVTLSALRATSPQGEALGKSYQTNYINSPQVEPLEKITEVLLLQIDLKKPDFDSKLVEAIARQNPHKLVFLLRYLQYAKLAVFYKKLYIGSWKPFEEVSLTLNGNNMNEVWLSFVWQVALYENGVVGVGGDGCDCRQQSSSQNRHCEPLNEAWQSTPFNKGGCQAEPDRGIFNDNNSKTSLSAKADISPYKGEYNGVITKSQLDHQLDLQNKAEAIKKEIVKLESAIRKERQPKRKFEMHQKMLELVESLESMGRSE